MTPRTTSIVLGGLLMAVGGTLASILPIPLVNSCLSCLALIGGGLFAVWHYTDRNRVTVTPGTGVAMGAQAGVVAFLVGAVILLVIWLFMGMPDFATLMEQQMARSGQGADMEGMDEVFAFMRNPLFVVIAVVVSLGFYVVAGLIGGAIGASVFKKGGDVAAEDTY